MKQNIEKYIKIVNGIAIVKLEYVERWLPV